MTKWQIRRIRQTLNIAIDYNYTLIDAHRTQYARGKGAYLKEKQIPRELKPYTDMWKRDIAAWKKILLSLPKTPKRRN